MTHPCHGDGGGEDGRDKQESRVVLQLAQIQYGVGVRARSTYTIHSVDEDYFSEV